MRFAIALAVLLITTCLGILLLAPRTSCAQSGCGLVPLKPLVPPGCRDLVAQCRCDEYGNACHWEWICVRD